MAMTVVDPLEMVDVEHQQRQRRSMPGRAGHLDLEQMLELAPVPGSRQSVGGRDRCSSALAACKAWLARSAASPTCCSASA